MLDGWVEPRLNRRESFIYALSQLVTKTLVLAELEVRKLRHDPSDLLIRGVQPALWLLVFGQVFTRTRAIPTGNLSYLDFMAPGILAQSVLFVAIFTGGMTLIWERDLGIVQKLLASPIPRAAMVLGKAVGCGVRCLPQIVIIYGLTLLLGVNVNLNPLALLQVLVIVLLGAGCFCVFSLIIGCLVKSRERFTGIGQLITMPLFFASNAIYPLSLMPGWLHILSSINPLTYQVDALRGTMLVNGSSLYGFGLDCTILLLTLIGLTIICGRLYPRVAM
ncbi:MAG: ABC transporter permease [Brasilonema octagenarum HA4186-MV1]|jgi:ABC-2 type transport system permease protein|uniref:Transport permease protein n=3 Tax=Scytonemataceae TaxID=1182 RepID=A0A856MF62_9CYAN|nr:ABC transporter permease [Brasilonema octagenarum]MBW4629481.1 ABC transporter permease [Brasilonema octagenarum HA4186-MV1]NMF61979.1 multidrug ABC transporter permease [Brasilonema octagenarum UFV-OR1]QDL08301.1 multidrug ABC transporter permease [Brasilonema sennae CENA114]QDL14657.1 multidrug ABC transporter permease [Brasilonema octagenarum UFV-E1]